MEPDGCWQAEHRRGTCRPQGAPGLHASVCGQFGPGQPPGATGQRLGTRGAPVPHASTALLMRFGRTLLPAAHSRRRTDSKPTLMRHFWGLGGAAAQLRLGLPWWRSPFCRLLSSVPVVPAGWSSHLPLKSNGPWHVTAASRPWQPWANRLCTLRCSHIAEL